MRTLRGWTSPRGVVIRRTFAPPRSRRPHEAGDGRGRRRRRDVLQRHPPQRDRLEGTARPARPQAKNTFRGGRRDVCRGSYLEDSFLPAHWSDATPTRKCCRSVLALGRFSPPTANPIWHRGVAVWSPLSGLRQTCTGAAPRDSTPHPTLLARAGDSIAMQPKPRAGVRLHSQSTLVMHFIPRARCEGITVCDASAGHHRWTATACCTTWKPCARRACARTSSTWC